MVASCCIHNDGNFSDNIREQEKAQEGIHAYVKAEMAIFIGISLQILETGMIQGPTRDTICSGSQDNARGYAVMIVWRTVLRLAYYSRCQTFATIRGKFCRWTPVSTLSSSSSEQRYASDESLPARGLGVHIPTGLHRWRSGWLLVVTGFSNSPQARAAISLLLCRSYFRGIVRAIYNIGC